MFPDLSGNKPPFREILQLSGYVMIIVPPIGLALSGRWSIIDVVCATLVGLVMILIAAYMKRREKLKSRSGMRDDGGSDAIARENKASDVDQTLR